MPNSPPKILLYDIETTPRKVYVWDHYEQNVLKVVEESYILCFSYKWLDEDEIHFVSIRDFPRYKTDKKNDKDLVKKLREVLDEASIVIGHNSKRFDNKWFRKECIKHKLGPPSPWHDIDTLTEARKYFKFHSNKLDDLLEFLGHKGKVKHYGMNLWFDCMKGDDKAWELMEEYALRDVEGLELIYRDMRPYMTTHPNLNQYEENKDYRCPMCKSYNVQKRGYTMKGKRSKAQRFQCQDCGKWSEGKTKIIKDIKIS